MAVNAQTGSLPYYSPQAIRLRSRGAVRNMR